MVTYVLLFDAVDQSRQEERQSQSRCQRSGAEKVDKPGSNDTGEGGHGRFCESRAVVQWHFLEPCEVLERRAVVR